LDLMMQRKRLEGALADWHPHPKDAHPQPMEGPPHPKDGAGSLAPMVRDPAPTREHAPPDEITERFFAEPPQGATPEPPAVVETGERRGPAEPAAIRARRRYLMRYVAGAVSLAALIGVGAIVRVTSARGALRASMSNASAAALPAVAPPADDPAVTAPEADPAPTPAPADSADEVAADNPEPDPQSALEAKKQSLHELELAHLAAATEAGERSVSLDPTDADAWRILGAAYQKRGAYADARRCFASCSKLATRGDRFECSALLR
jgi:hypothetical protein